MWFAVVLNRRLGDVVPYTVSCRRLGTPRRLRLCACNRRQYRLRFSGLSEYLIVRLTDILQIMGIGAAYHMAVQKIRVLPLNLMEVFKVMDFRAGKRAVRGNEPQVGEKTGGSLVNVRRISDSAVGGDERKSLVKRDIRGVD